MCLLVAVSKSGGGELRVLLGEHSAYQTKNYLVKQRWLSLWVGADFFFAFLDGNYMGG